MNSWHKFNHNHQNKFLLTASKTVCGNKRSEDTSEAAHRQKNRETRLKEGENCQGERKVSYGVSRNSYESVIPEYIQTLQFPNKDIRSVLLKYFQ